MGCLFCSAKAVFDAYKFNIARLNFIPFFVHSLFDSECLLMVSLEFLLLLAHMCLLSTYDNVT